MISRLKNATLSNLALKKRFALSGSLTFAFNMLLAKAAFSFEIARSSSLNRNLTNVLVTEGALIFGFFLHNFITWQRDWSRFFRKLFLFHVISSIGLVIRFATFAGLDYMGLNWFFATVFSIAPVIIINFLGFDRLVFKDMQKELGDPNEAE